MTRSVKWMDVGRPATAYGKKAPLRLPRHMGHLRLILSGPRLQYCTRYKLHRFTSSRGHPTQVLATTTHQPPSHPQLAVPVRGQRAQAWPRKCRPPIPTRLTPSRFRQAVISASPTLRLLLAPWAAHLVSRCDMPLNQATMAIV